MNRLDIQPTTQPASQPVAQNRLDANTPAVYTPPKMTPLQRVGDFLDYQYEGLPNSIGVVGGAILNFIKEMGQSVVRSGIGTVLSLGKFKQDHPTDQPIDTPIGPIKIGPPDLIAMGLKNLNFEQVQIPNWLQWATGKDKVEELGKQAFDLSKSIEGSPFAQKYGFDKFSVPLAIGGIAINTGLDLSFFAGGEKGVIEQLAKESSPEGIAKILKAIGTDDELIKIFAPKFATLVDKGEIKDALNILKGAQGLKVGSLITKETAQDLPNLIPSTLEEFNKLSPVMQDNVFPYIDDALKMQITSAPLPSEAGHTVLDSYVQRILDGDMKVRTGTNLKTEALEALGKGRYMRIFTKDAKAEALDQIVQQINDRSLREISESDLIDALVKGYDERVSKLGPGAIDTLGTKARPGTGASINKAADTLLKLPTEEKAAFKPIIDQTAKTVKDKVHIMDYFQTPEFVLKKLGLEGESQLLHDSFDAYRKQVKQEINKIVQWKNDVGNIPGAAEQIFKYLDGWEGIVLSPEERKVAQEMQLYLADWADKLKLPKDSRIANYITHIFEEDFIKKEFDPELARIITDKTAGSVYNPFLEKRLGAMGYKLDAFAALDAYVKRATRKINMDPALEALKKASENLDVESAKYISRLSHRINLRPTEVDNLIDNLFKSVFGYKFGQRPTARISTMVRQWVYRGTLGLNLGSALRNLTQGANTYAKLGEKYTVVGYSTLFSRLITRNLDELVERGILDDALIQDRKIGVYKSMLQKLDGTLFKFFDIAEKINRGAAYFGAKAKFIANGSSEEEAVNLAKKLVRETQFAFGNIDSPVIMSSDLAKMGFQLQTYNVKQIEFLKNMIKNKEFGGLLRYAGASLVAVYSIGRLFGMKPSDIIPTFRLGGSPTGNFLTGLGDLLSSNQQQRAAAPGKIETAASSFFPAGSQIRKTIQGLNVVSQGKDTTPTGKTRYKVEQTPANFIRAGLFGKSSLPAAQEYYSNIGKKKPAKSSVGNRLNQ